MMVFPASRAQPAVAANGHKLQSAPTGAAEENVSDVRQTLSNRPNQTVATPRTELAFCLPNENLCRRNTIPEFGVY